MVKQTQFSNALLTAIAATVKGYRDRESQIEMICAVEDTLVASKGGNKPMLVTEAPCGVGKSLGYLVPSTTFAIRERVKIVVATGTVALQEQLVSKDLPVVKAAAGGALSYALLKGRNRYACVAKLDRALSKSISGSMFGGTDYGPLSADGRVKIETMRRLLTDGKWNGERDSYPGRVEDALWHRVGADKASCVGVACQFYDQCSFFAARKAAENADIKVVNHDLLLANAATGGKVFEADEKVILIVDEAHKLPEKALDHFAERSHITTESGWISEAVAKLHDLVDSNPAEQALRTAVEQFDIEARKLGPVLTSVYTALNTLPQMAELWEREKGTQITVKFSGGIIPTELQVITTQAGEIAGDAVVAVDELRQALVDAIGTGALSQSRADGEIGLVGDLASRLDKLAGSMRQFGRLDPAGAPPHARWVIGEADGKGRVGYDVNSSPISAAKALQERLWSQYGAAVCCSATIRTLGDFRRYCRRIGVAGRDNVKCLAVPSPFDFERNGQLILPMMRYTPKQQEEFTNEVIEKLPQYLGETHGSLVLYCSRWQMTRVLEGLPKELQARVLVQGSQDRESLLREHARRVAAGEQSVLFGMDSFMEGLDLPGKLCETVIIPKVPFAVPDGPVAEATSDWLKSVGRDPFYELSLPQASLKLTQAVGRLLRSETDVGRVVIMDSRLKNSKYGRQLLDALPPLRRVTA